jgi:hypothetical protein
MFNNNTRQNSITNRSVYYVRDNKKQRVKLLETITNSNDKDLVLGLLNIHIITHYNDIDIYELCGIIIYNERLNK